MRSARRYLPRLDAETPMLALSTIMMASEAGCACDYEEAAEGLRRAAALPAPNLVAAASRDHHDHAGALRRSPLGAQ